MERKPNVPKKAEPASKPEPKTPKWMLGWTRRDPSVSEEWAQSLPPGPLVAHLTQLHAILLVLGAETAPDVLTVAEHSLTEIARYTTETQEPS